MNELREKAMEIIKENLDFHVTEHVGMTSNVKWMFVGAIDMCYDLGLITAEEKSHYLIVLDDDIWLARYSASEV